MSQTFLQTYLNEEYTTISNTSSAAMTSKGGGWFYFFMNNPKPDLTCSKVKQKHYKLNSLLYFNLFQNNGRVAGFSPQQGTLRNIKNE